jgi:hypothetical protein
MILKLINNTLRLLLKTTRVKAVKIKILNKQISQSCLITMLKKYKKKIIKAHLYKRVKNFKSFNKKDLF